jgi:hypothetical protein
MGTTFCHAAAAAACIFPASSIGMPFAPIARAFPLLQLFYWCDTGLEPRHQSELSDNISAGNKKKRKRKRREWNGSLSTILEERGDRGVVVAEHERETEVKRSLDK